MFEGDVLPQEISPEDIPVKYRGGDICSECLVNVIEFEELAVDYSMEARREFAQIIRRHAKSLDLFKMNTKNLARWLHPENPNQRLLEASINLLGCTCDDQRHREV